MARAEFIVVLMDGEVHRGVWQDGRWAGSEVLQWWVDEHVRQRATVRIGDQPVPVSWDNGPTVCGAVRLLVRARVHVTADFDERAPYEVPEGFPRVPILGQ